MSPTHTIPFLRTRSRGKTDPARSGPPPEVEVAGTPSWSPSGPRLLRPRLGEILVGLELLTRPQMEEVIVQHAKEGGLFGQAVLRVRSTSKADLSRALAIQRELRMIAVSEHVPATVLRKMPSEVAARLDVLPLTFVDNGRVLAVATGTPQEEVMQADIRELVGMLVVFCEASGAALHELVLNAYSLEGPHLSAASWSVQPVARPPVEYKGETLIGPITKESVEPRSVETVDYPFSQQSPARRVGNILVSRGALDPLALQRALDHQRKWGGRLCSVLVELELVSPATLAETLACEVGAAVVPLRECPSESAALRLLSPELCERLRLLPLAVGLDGSGQQVLVVATADPTDGAALYEAHAAARRTLRVVVAREDEVSEAVRRQYRRQLPEPVIAAGQASFDPVDLWHGPLSYQQHLPEALDPPPCLSVILSALESPLADHAELTAEDLDPIVSGLLTPIEEEASSSAGEAPASLLPETVNDRRRRRSHGFSRLVVVTGDASSGREELLEALQQHFPDLLVLPPDFATELQVLAAAPWPLESAHRTAVLEAILRTIENERVALEDGRYSLVVAQHGTIDCLESWCGTETSFWQDLNTTREEQYARYDAVVHLRPPSTDEDGTRNTRRTWRAREEVWAGHPQVSCVDWTADFQQRLAILATCIGAGLLPREYRETGVA